MDQQPALTDDEQAEAGALAAAIDEALVEDRWVPHDVVRAWLLRIANGDLKAPPPKPP